MSRYLEGVRRGEELGCIKKRGPQSDEYAHFGDNPVDGLGARNSRLLGAIGHSLARSYVGEWSFCDAGAGAGVAASAAHHLGATRICTLGYTPINPFLRFSDWVCMKPSRLNVFEHAFDRIVRTVGDGARYRFNMDELILRWGERLFDELAHPYVDEQWIGDQKSYVGDLPKMDFIHEILGVIHYSIRQGQRLALLQDWVGRLTDRGALLTAFPLCERDLRGHDRPFGDAVGLLNPRPGYAYSTLVLQPAHPWYEALGRFADLGEVKGFHIANQGLGDFVKEFLEPSEVPRSLESQVISI